MHIAQQSGKSKPVNSKDQIALTRAEQNEKQLMERATAARHRIQIGGWLFGGWIGLIVGLKTLNLAAGKRYTEFEPERSACFGCARCFLSCPQERTRIGLPVQPIALKTSTPEATANRA
jgi:ferredoxin